MNKGTIIFIFGLALLLIPTLGIPTWWKQSIFLAMGIVLLLLGYLVRRADYLYTIESHSGLRTEDTFIEATTPLFSESKAD